MHETITLDSEDLDTLIEYLMDFSWEYYRRYEKWEEGKEKDYMGKCSDEIDELIGKIKESRDL